VTILGIDPGYAIVGFGIIKAEKNDYSIVQCGAINTPAGEEMPKRLTQIYHDMNDLLNAFKPDSVAIEELFFNTNVTTGIAVAQARGVILVACEEHGIPVYEYTPSQVKQAVVGYGRAEKHQVMDMTKRLLRLNSLPKPDDAADGLALALCHARASKSIISKVSPM